MRGVDLTDRTFGRWLVLRLFDTVRYDYPKGGSCTVLRWLCRCACGNEKIVRGNTLRNGSTVSCGCYQKEFQRAKQTKHGLANSPEYAAWAHMLDRCRNPNNPGYKDYGGRGITVCKRWYDAAKFLRDMGQRPSPKHSLERNNNELGYSPDNCRWATSGDQGNNKRVNRRLRFNGKVQTVAQWAQEIGMKSKTIHKRLRLGWTTMQALTIPPSADKTGWEARRKRQGG